MTWLALQLLIGGKLRSAFGWITASSSHLLIVACAAIGAWGWLGHHEAAKWHRVADHCASARKADQQAVAAAQKEATARQLAQNQAVERAYSEEARKSDAEHQTALADAQRATDAYIAAHRMRAAPVHSISTAAGPQGDGAGLPAPVPADPIVAIDEPDVQACKADATIAVDAYNWAQTLLADGLAQ